MRHMKQQKLPRRFTALLLCLCMILSMVSGLGLVTTVASGAGPTEHVAGTRVADPNTMDDYQNRLLTAENGSRYAGRVWTDKTVFAYGADKANGGTLNNEIVLDMATDGYVGNVGFNADFAHVFSALASSQVVNEYPPQPLDVMFVIDVSGSMGKIPSGEIATEGNFEESAIYKAVDSVNKAITLLLKENPRSRFGIVIYGSTAAVFVPLGFYSSGELVATCGEAYGGTQGLHYTLTATVVPAEEMPDGKIVSTESKKTYYAGNAGKTSNEVHSKNGDGNRKLAGTSGRTDGDGTLGNPYQVGHITNPQAGLAAAMDQFITNNEKLTWHTVVEDREYARLPALIHLTDGQASDLAWIQPTEETGDEWQKTVSNWNNVNWQYDLAYNSKINTEIEKEASEDLYNASQLTGYGDAAPVIFQTLMTASYYKSAVEAYYNSSGAKTRDGEPVSLQCFSIYASDQDKYEDLDDNQVKATIDAILCPAEYFKDDAAYSDKDSGKLTKEDSVRCYIDTAYELYNDWVKTGNVEAAFSENTTSANKPENDITISLNTQQSQLKSGKYSNELWHDKIDEDSIDKNVNYVPKGNFYKTGFEGLGDVFQTVVEKLLNSAFVPISGSNDAGVDGSITYQDPIGDYMEIKNQSITATPHHTEGEQVSETETTYDMSMLLFGEMHGLVRTGVYDFQWNDKWMESKYPNDKGGKAITQGWYKGEPEEAIYGGTDEVPKESNGTGTELYKSAADAWAAGWVYRLNFQTLSQYVPLVNAPAKPEELSPQAKNTVYTLYRFAGSAQNRNALRRNPIYGEVPGELAASWEKYDTSGNYPTDNSTYASTPGVYRLSDIRVWVEDTGDYVNEEGAITPNSGYDRSLYVNVPAAAIPTELATITIDENGKVLSYETNLGSDHAPKNGAEISDGEGGKRKVNDEDYMNFCYQSTPLRLFYAVGLEEDVIFRDDDGNQTGVDFNKISAEYIQSHTVEGQNYVWFISNFYSGTKYGEYATDAENYTRGDPTVTFSPGADNRYYVFQKALPLYAHAYRYVGGKLVPVDRIDGQSFGANKQGNSGTTWETYNGKQQKASSWDGGQFMGTYANEEAFLQTAKSSADGKITDQNENTYDIVENGIVFLEEDLLDHVTSNGSSYAEGSVSFSSDDYFFILLEFYMPDKGVGVDNENHEVAGTSKGHMVQYAIARKGSEFGSGYASGNISNGDMLCWADANGNLNVEFAYVSRSETGDNTRGEPTFDKLKKTNGELKEYLQSTCNLSGAALDAQVDYWTKMQKDSAVQKAMEEIDSETKFKERFKFTVAAKPGGIRTGDMSNNIQDKEEEYNSDKGTTEFGKTNTSATYYLPTVADDSGVGDEVIINNYLGNNGRLEIANQMLHVTKMVELPDGTAVPSDEEFNYQIFVQGVTGKRSAVRTLYNEYSGTWERRLAYIDVLTDNSDLLLDNSDNRALFELQVDSTAKQVVANEEGQLVYADGDGNPTTDQCSGTTLYYLYLKSNGEHTRRLYRDSAYVDTNFKDFSKNGTTTFFKDGDREETRSEPGAANRDSYRIATSERPAGTRTYWVLDAVLIPKTEVEDAESAGNWTYNASDSGHEALKYHTLVIRKPNDETSETAFSSPYKTRTQYMTTELDFGTTANGDQLAAEDLYDSIIPSGDRPDLFANLTNDQIAKNTAEFTLKHGEGLLLTGLDNRITYRFTEKLTQAQVDFGYSLKEVSHIQQRGSESIYRPGTQQIPIYSYDGAIYGGQYGTYAKSKTENGLTWAVDTNGTHNNESYRHMEPFAHTNAVMWEYYATMEAGSSGNHHQPSGVEPETENMQIWDQHTANSYTSTEVQHTVSNNPNCEVCDELLLDGSGSVLHYMYKDGELVDPHYEGEASTYLRNMARYGVSPTVHFAVTNEPDTSIVPSTPNDDYTGVYSVFGNTGWFEEQVHFVNTYEPDKKETDPGDGKQVQVGDEITYEISYYNITADTAPVIIVDRLDPGVDFVRATDEGFYRYFDKASTAEYVIRGDTKSIKVPAHTVVWVMNDVAPNTGGTVTLTVRVNENAKKLWQYGDDYLGEREQDPKENDFEVVDKAGVQVGNGPMLYTDQVENPVTEKIESDPGDGETVEVGDEVTYEISWRNTEDVSQEIIVTDWLDDGVDFVSASFKDITLTTAGVISGSVGEGEETQAITIAYETGHKVTWTIKNAAPGEYGTVTLKVKVNANAVKKWSYQGESGDGTADDHATDWKIINRAEVDIGNDDHFVTKQVENPLQEKTEIDPGDGKQVLVGDTITYEIQYHNNTAKTASITIMDTLDPGVTFDSATDEGVYHGEAGTLDDEEAPGYGETIPAHSVVWVLKDLAPGASGTVQVTVRVNARAFENWQYNEDNGTLTNGNGKDYEVVNKASIKVGDENWHYTNVVENPVPEKTETDPGAGEGVAVGDEVTYEIGWRNATNKDQTVTVEDWLDDGVDFVSAAFKDVELKAGKETVTYTIPKGASGEENQTVTITYSASEHKVTWTIDKVAPGEIGTVQLIVRVNENAFIKWSYPDKQGDGTANPYEQDYKIVNRAEVCIDNDRKVTPEVENPVLEKTEIHPGSGEQVGIGDQVDYSITWNNYETETADVTVRDALDPGVDFLSASFGSVTLNAYDLDSDTSIYSISGDASIYYYLGNDTYVKCHVTITYNGNSHEIVWFIENVPAGYCGTVQFSVQVNENADKGYRYDNNGNIPSYPVGEDDYKILNQGGVTVGNHSEYLTNIIENPTRPTFVPKVKKVLEGDPLPLGNFTFTLEENPGNHPGAIMPEITTQTIKGYGEAEFDEIIFTAPGNYSFTIRESVLNPEPGYTYDDSVWTLTVYVEGPDGKWKASGYYTKESATSDTEATFTNAYEEPKPETGSLTVKKTVTGDTGDKTKEWHFTVTLSDGTVNGKFGGMTFTSGVATFTLKHDESATATGLPAGITYTVEETEANQDGYGTTVTNDTGTIPTNGTATAAFVNDKSDGEPHKVEVTPGDGEVVQIGDEITYRIDWKNSSGKEAEIRIEDPLDQGVDFVSATNGGTYDAVSHTVQWNLGKQAPGANGSVTLVVRVNAMALQNEGSKVDNQATVYVDNNPTVTEIPENPVEPGGDPHKTETDPGNYLGVKVGDNITYSIFWVNWTGKTAEVSITDPLDVGVDFVSASDGGTYDPATRTVTWNLGSKPADDSGYVTLVVKVNASALAKADRTVYNQATVTVDNESRQTEIPENPVEPGGDPHKTETTPGNRVGVEVGENITYRITWVNWTGKTASVTITDPLDVGVDFVSASDGGTYDPATRTVTWNLGSKPADDSGYVTLVVKVNASALAKADRTVYNQATVTVDNESRQTEIPENPVEPGGDPHKTETTPGNRVGVEVGENITYRIDWVNWSGKAAEITILDPLDTGVDFVSASDGGRYDAASHTVIWDIGNKPAEDSGYVTLVVKVNESALDKADRTVYNQAIVFVDNDSKMTEIPENPVEPEGEPHKTEVTPGDGQTVKVGDVITYRIDWINWTGDTAAISITDPLDSGVDFVSASDGGTYNAATHTVTWNLGDKVPGASGSVTLAVKVNADAPEKADKTVYNQATVTVGNESKQTEIPENPVEPEGEPHKTEVTPGDGQTVKVGDVITYRIDWINWTGDTAAVSITDPLDSGVDFVSASDGGTYNAATHTVTWNLGDKTSGASGSVTLVVKVNANAPAKADKTVYNQATVTVGNESKQTEIPENPVEGAGELTVTKILEGENADPNKDWTFTVTLSDTSINGTYGSMTFTNGVATFTLKGGESLTATGLPAGTTYTVAEAEANQDGYTTTSTGETGEIPAEGSAEAVFTNSIGVGDLTVTKILEGESADPNKDWTFTVTLSDPTINGTYGSMTFTNGVATFTLKGGESLTATGLPAGITYTVTEAEANTDGYKTTSTGETGEIPAEGSAEAVFTNSIDTGALTVTKILEGENADPNKDWTFTVTLSDTSINGTYGSMTFTNGVATFTLKGGESLTATGLPAGITYTVTEAEANADGYKTTSTGETGEILAEGSAEAVFTNSIEAGALTVVKNIEGKEADPNKDWTFTVTLSDTTINGTYGGMTFVNGVATFTLKGGESLTATGLPAGISYTVTEAEANTDGYTTRSAFTNGTIPEDGEAVATFVNSKGEVEKGNFAVRKRVRGEDADPNQVFHFIITLSDPTLSGTFGDVTFENGVGYAALKDGEHAWILGLPVGTTYTVTEVEANQDGYQTHGEGETGAVPATGHTEARFTNFRGPGEPNWDEPWEDLPDPEVPLAPPEDNPSDNPPQTNDQSNREMWMLMMAAAFLGMTAQFLPGKRKEEA